MAASKKSEAKAEVTEDAKVTVETPDHAKIEQERLAKAEAEHAATLRQQQVAGLETELAFLQRQPKPNAARIKEVEGQISLYSEAPARTRETR